jgi:hypothetical protein
MKNILINLSLILAATALRAQNIVPNYSFEQADSCPTGLNNRFYKYSSGCIGWGQANNNTTDYYNGCDTAALSVGLQHPRAGVPYNVWGYQKAYDGVAYTGICMYYAHSNDYKEYLITTIPALSVDTVYKVSIAVSLADSSAFAVSGLGAFFSTYGSPNQINIGTLLETPQIDYSSYGIISDTAHWITLSGTFVADSAYTNIIIGGFKSSTNMSISTFNSLSTTNAAYYYVDAVVVEKLSSTGIANINSTDNVHIYPNPFTDHAILQFNNPFGDDYTITLFNAQGQVAQQIQVSSDKTRIDRNNLPAGFYYYQLRNADNIVANGKLRIL